MMEWILVAVLALLNIAWMAVIIINPRDIMRWRKVDKPSFSSESLECLDLLATWLEDRRRILPSISLLEAYAMGVGFERAAAAMAGGVLQIERFCGRALAQVGNRVRLPMPLREERSQPIISHELSVAFQQRIESLLRAISQRSVIRCYEVLVDLMFMSVVGRIPLSNSPAQVRQLRHGFPDAIDDLADSIENGLPGVLVLFGEQWIGPVIDSGDAYGYFFLDFSQDLRDELYAYSRDWSLGQREIPLKDVAVCIREYGQGLRRDDRLQQYRAIVRLLSYVPGVTGVVRRSEVRLELARVTAGQ